MERRYCVVDVFSGSPLQGNPVAVVLDSEGLSTEDMLAITRWLNLSETTFMGTPSTDDAHYSLRIFTLDREMPFAGHPTLGSCRAWLANNPEFAAFDVVTQECGAGLVPIRRTEDRLAFSAPPLLRSGPVEEQLLEEVCGFLDLDPQQIVDSRWVDNGPGWLGIMLGSAEEVLALSPAAAHPKRIDVGVVGPQPSGARSQFELRALFSDHTGAVREDPVTGSLNASIAQWLFDTGRASDSYTATQGRRVGRDGVIHVERDPDGSIWVGGATSVVVTGTIDV